MPSLQIWMNGQKVGEWGTLRTGSPFFRYERTWVESPHARALSLSLPITADLELRGQVVDNYFDNLLPDNAAIRRRIRERFKTSSTNAFDLLTAIGRDCVGAVQLLPIGEAPEGWDRVQAEALTDEGVEKALSAVTAGSSFGPQEEEFRISLAGAQEKTAFLGMAGKWFFPRHATPTTHIFKLPLGIIGGFRGDFSHSVENEWLCAQILKGLGLPVAETEIADFGKQRVLVVTRFDRRWIGTAIDAEKKKSFRPKDGVWIARLPQEDLCQALGLPSDKKYESDKGPSMSKCLALLESSEDSLSDRTNFVLAQLVFWLLAATDGHGKNFSIHHSAGGEYRMTPLYDVLSAWPIIGHGKRQLPIEKAKMAMAVRGKNAHYRINEILPRHWKALAESKGIRNVWGNMLELVENIDQVIENLETKLPPKFPDRVFRTIQAGVKRRASTFLARGTAAK